MSLLFLVTTRCPDVIVELTQLSRKLTKDRFQLLTSLVYPLELHVQLLASHLLPSYPAPALRERPLPSPQAQLPLPSIDTLRITNPFPHQPSIKYPVINLPRAQFTAEVHAVTRHPVQLENSSTPLKTQKIKSLSLYKASVANKGQVVWQKKRMKLSCENCDAGTTTCHRCQSWQSENTG